MRRDVGEFLQHPTGAARLGRNFALTPASSPDSTPTLSPSQTPQLILLTVQLLRLKTTAHLVPYLMKHFVIHRAQRGPGYSPAFGGVSSCGENWGTTVGRLPAGRGRRLLVGIGKQRLRAELLRSTADHLHAFEMIGSVLMGF